MIESRNSKDIHEAHYGYIKSISDEEIKEFIKNEYSRPGAEENMTTRDVVRDFIGALNIVHQNPDFDRKQIFGGNSNENNNELNEDLMSRFKRVNQ